MLENRPEGLREEDVRRIVREETRGQDAVPPQGAPIVDPTPVGLAAFALTTFLFSIINAGWLDQIGTFIPLAFFYGGLAQLLSGMWAFRNNDTFGAVVFTSYGAFWGALGFLFFSADSLGVLADVGATVGFTLVGWSVFTFYLWIAAIRVNKAMFVTFTAFLITLILLDLGFLLAVQGVIIAGGYAGIVLALCAWYTSAAGVLKHAFGRTVLPQGVPFGQPTPAEPQPITPERTTEPPPPQESPQRLTTTLPPTPAPTPESTQQTTTPERTTEQSTPEIPTTEPTTEQPPEEGQQQLNAQVASQEPPERTPQRGREEAERSMREDLRSSSITREDMGSIIRESVRRSEVRKEEAPQAEPSPVLETRADAEELPIEIYDSLSVAAVTRRLGELSVEEIERLRDYEAKNQNRRTLMQRFERRIKFIRVGRKDGTTGKPR